MIKHVLFTTIVAVKIAIASSIFAPANAISTYTIGNSLTWDAKPSNLDGDVGYHIGCSTNLQQIYDNPSTSACRTPTSFGTWDVALWNNQFDYVTVQPHYGTTLEQDLAIINEWMQMQPSATFVIHTGWTDQEAFEATYHDTNSSNLILKSAAYYSNLTDRLVQDNPNREIVSTQAFDVLDSISHDIENGNSPFSSFDRLFRDIIHMSDTGSYLVHNLMRQALGQPLSDPVGLESSEIQTYLDAKILAVAPQQSVPFEFTSTLGILIVGGIFSISRWEQVSFVRTNELNESKRSITTLKSGVVRRGNK